MNTNQNSIIFMKSKHAIKRFQQRGITDWAILEVLKYGESIHKQGLVFRYIPKRDVERFYSPDQANDLNNVVLIQGQDDVLVTGYKNLDAIRKIKIKSKRLLGKSKGSQSKTRITPSTFHSQAA